MVKLQIINNLNKSQGFFRMQRLQKFLAEHGVASRRKCEDIIASGRVRVNGERINELGTKVDPMVDVVEVDGVVLGSKPENIYIALHKPKDVVTTVSDPQGRKTVLQLLQGVRERVFPVGRLDYDTQGLLLVTNDGGLSYTLTHPSHEVEKTYLAEVKGVPSPEKIALLRRGIELEDGLTAPAAVDLLEQGEMSQVRIVIHEGRKRQVRRMFDAIGHPVINLVRVRFGPISLGELKTGSFRYLNEREIEQLKTIEKRIRARAKRSTVR